MKLGIVGSRKFNNYEVLEQVILKVLNEWGKTLQDIECIVSGGAKGADTLAEQFAKKYNIEVCVYKPDWSLGKRAGIMRNTDIVNNSTHMIAFPSRFGKGTQDSIRKAQKKQITLKILYID